MLDAATPKGRLISAAMRLAEERPWREVSLLDIAMAAGVSLADLRVSFDSKGAIVRGFVQAIDDALLRQTRRLPEGDGPRDALFEVIMARLDLLVPYKPAVRSIMVSAEPDPGTLRTLLCSQHWMLQAAGIETEGARGAVRTLGLASVYASVFQTWLEDEDPGMARTMAALDRRLRRGERNLQALEGLCEAASGLGRRLGSMLGGGGRGRPAAPASDARHDPPTRGSGVTDTESG